MLAHQQATTSRSGIASWSRLQSLPFSTLRRRSQTFARGASLTVSDAKKVLVPVANGSEEIEAVMCHLALSIGYMSIMQGHITCEMVNMQVVIIDVLRRAGADVTVASVEDTLQVVYLCRLAAEKGIATRPGLTDRNCTNRPVFYSSHWCRWICPDRLSWLQTSPSRTLPMTAMTQSRSRCGTASNKLMPFATVICR